MSVSGFEFWSLNNEKLKSVWEQEHQFSNNWSKGNNNSICRESARLGLGYFVINVARRYVEFNTRKAICQCCWCWCWLEGKVAPVQSTFCEYCYFGQIHREENLEDKLGDGRRRVGGSGRAWSRILPVGHRPSSCLEFAWGENIERHPNKSQYIPLLSFPR